jgi:hypothetical protein
MLADSGVIKERFPIDLGRKTWVGGFQSLAGYFLLFFGRLQARQFAARGEFLFTLGISQPVEMPDTNEVLEQNI